MNSLAFLIPGSLDQLTGGYLFDSQVVDGLRALGRTVNVYELAGCHPAADDVARASAARALAGLPNGGAAVIDGLALPAFADCLASETRRLQLVGFIHHPLSLETGLGAADVRHYAALEARLWPLLRGNLCPSEHTARAIRAAGVAPDRVLVTRPGTAKPDLALSPGLSGSTGSRPAWAGGAGAPRPRSISSAAAGALQAPVHLLCVGTVTPRKGHLLLIEALVGLREYAWQLTCIGSLERDPVAAARLRGAIAAHGLGERVSLLGEQPAGHLARAYREADVFVLPSCHEGYGMAYAEAMVHGLPIVATLAGAIPDTVPRSASLLVPPGDALALRNALRQLLGDARLRERLAVAARLAGAALPDWPKAVRHWVGAFDSLVT